MVLILFLVWGYYWYWDLQLKNMRRLESSLREYALELLAGNYYPRFTVESEQTKLLAPLLETARRQGVALDGAVAAFGKMLQHSQRAIDGARAFWGVVCVRVSLLVMIGYGMRLAISGGWGVLLMRSDSVGDLFCQICAVLAVGGACAYLYVKTRRHPFWQHGLSDLALEFAYVLFTDRSDAKKVANIELQALSAEARRQELTKGVSMRAERLRRWEWLAQSKINQYQERLKHLSDLFPLWELSLSVVYLALVNAALLTHYLQRI